MNPYLALIDSKLRRRFHPLFVSWMITDRCNMRCQACARNESVLGDAGEELLVRIAAEAVKHSVWKINLTGGEPLLHPQIRRFIEVLSNTGVRVTINTNGLLLPAFTDSLDRLSGVGLSLDGGPEEHDRLRGPGAHDALCRALETLNKRGVPFKLTCVIGELTTEKHIDAVVDTAKKYGGAVVFQPGRMLALGAAHPNPNAPERDVYVRMMMRVVEIKKKNPLMVMNSLNGLKHLIRWPYDTKISCAAGRIFCRIDPKGDIYSCSNILENTKPIGNIITYGLFAPFEGYSSEECAQCWSGERVEANLMFALKPGPAVNFIRSRGARFKR